MIMKTAHTYPYPTQLPTTASMQAALDNCQRLLDACDRIIKINLQLRQCKPGTKKHLLLTAALLVARMAMKLRRLQLSAQKDLMRAHVARI
jgi:hypothetical protein